MVCRGSTEVRVTKDFAAVRNEGCSAAVESPRRNRTNCHICVSFSSYDGSRLYKVTMVKKDLTYGTQFRNLFSSNAKYI